MGLSGRVLRLLRPHLRGLAGAAVMALAAGLVELAQPWTLKIVVDYVLGDRPLPEGGAAVVAVLPGPATRGALLGWTVAAAVVLVGLDLWLNLVLTRRVLRVAQGSVLELAHQVFEKMQRLSLAFHRRHQVGDLLQRSTQDVFIGAVVAQTVLPGVVALLMLVVMFTVLARVDLLLTGVALAVVPLLLLALRWFAPRLDRTTKEQFDRWGTLMAFVENALSAVRVIQAFSAQHSVQDRVRREARGVAQAYAGTTMINTAWDRATVAITGLGSAAVLGVGALRVLSGSLTLGDLLIFTSYLMTLYTPLQMMSKGVAGLVELNSRGRRVLEVLDADEDVAEPEHPVVPARVLGEVTYRNVRFGYDHGTPILERVNLRAKPGRVTAIVGPSGAGKSSLVSLLPRFYDPWEGQVLLDGIDVRAYRLELLRDSIALVLQDPYLLPITVADNIRLGRPGADGADVERAARQAEAHGFIEELPDGYDTVLGEHENSLSGGQAQRIALARALVKGAPVLVLDEPTSALDAETEADILRALVTAARERTVLLISHRATTVAIADETWRLEAGTLTEAGTAAPALAGPVARRS
jgi:ATP-binding cassette subfamily B protein/subfamily B ATP-binding cassette protein MsbA